MIDAGDPFEKIGNDKIEILQQNRSAAVPHPRSPFRSQREPGGSAAGRSGSDENVPRCPTHSGFAAGNFGLIRSLKSFTGCISTWPSAYPTLIPSVPGARSSGFS